MSEREMGIEDARAKLGDLVRDAQQHNMTTHITRNGKPAAVLMRDDRTIYTYAIEISHDDEIWMPERDEAVAER